MNQNDQILQSAGIDVSGDDTLWVKFFVEPVENKRKSKEEGRPIFEDTEFISIKSPGSTNEVRRPIRLTDTHRFPRHYEAFKAREEMVMEGMPLSEWTGVTRSQVEELKFLSIATVEQLASCPDHSVQNMRGLMTLKQNAIKYLGDAKSGAALKAENDDLKTRMAELEAKLAAIVPRGTSDEDSDLHAVTASRPKARRKRRTKAEMEAAKAAQE